MTHLPLFPHTNQLLAALPVNEKDAFMAACEPVDLEFNEVLVQPGQRIRHIYFPIDGVISMIVKLDDESRLEVTMVGCEGMLGISLILGVKEAPLCALVQGAGTALRMEAVHFKKLLSDSPGFHQRLKRYVYVMLNQSLQSVACNHFHQVEARLARWLLMTQDRAGTAQLRLTHEFLAMMLGVRRAGITLAAIALQKRGLISYHRGDVRVIDRSGLIEASCSCYITNRALYARVMEVKV